MVNVLGFKFLSNGIHYNNFKHDHSYPTIDLAFVNEGESSSKRDSVEKIYKNRYRQSDRQAFRMTKTLFEPL